MQMQDSWVSYVPSLALDPTIGIQSHKISDLIPVPSFCYSQCVCVCGGGGGGVCVCVCVCSGFFVLFFCIILYVNCFGRTMLYMCTEYHSEVNMYHLRAKGVDERMIKVHYYSEVLF